MRNPGVEVRESEWTLNGIRISQSFLDRHPVEITRADGMVVARFASLECAARTIALRRIKDGRARNVVSGEEWDQRQCVQWHNVHTGGLR